MPRPKSSPVLLFLLIVVLSPVLYSVFSTGVSLAYVSLPILAMVAIAWFVWRVFGRVWWRANNIAHARERRLLREASMR